MRRTTFLVTLAVGCAYCQTADLPPKAHHLIGLENVKRNASGTLNIQNGSLTFKSKKDATVPLDSIQDIYVGTETTQGGGTVGTVVKTASLAAPYHSGSVLTLLLRTKVDMLTVTYHDPDGALHAAIFSVPKGQAPLFRTRLIAAGAHAGNLADTPSDKELKERKSQ
jgi:hypothetical protein